MHALRVRGNLLVHCRIGSLEKQAEVLPSVGLVHCRIGSLENAQAEEELSK